ncbi:transcription termination/antitermination protein NusA, partial [bacterium]
VRVVKHHVDLLVVQLVDDRLDARTARSDAGTERIDPIGACIGPRGARVQAIVDELNDEKIDVVLYNTDMKKFVIDALSPAKVNSLKLTKRTNERGEEEDHAYVVVPDSQLSLAIGKGGQNVRLAARLTDCKIDIRGESQAAEDKAHG